MFLFMTIRSSNYFGARSKCFVATDWSLIDTQTLHALAISIPPKSRLVKYSQMHVYMAYLPTFGLNFWKYTSPIEHVGLKPFLMTPPGP